MDGAVLRGAGVEGMKAQPASDRAVLTISERPGLFLAAISAREGHTITGGPFQMFKGTVHVVCTGGMLIYTSRQPFTLDAIGRSIPAVEIEVPEGRVRPY